MCLEKTEDNLLLNEHHNVLAWLQGDHFDHGPVAGIGLWKPTAEKQLDYSLEQEEY